MKRYPIIFIIFLLYGCISQIVSLDEYTKNWMGHSIEKLRKLDLKPTSFPSRMGWKETTYELDDGKWVYVELARKDCFIHWEVNPEGIIIGHKLEGSDCQR